ncbi:hypothetical protein ABEG18_08205 [Alsobacter sp. KACC 23698]|uniref:Uncharacterized protein n=1 Tax=Alsobacter sp. KACC 23698 TaxID=3149229 RepID=A0AAU7JKJ3_9HYPH
MKRIAMISLGLALGTTAAAAQPWDGGDYGGGWRGHDNGQNRGWRREWRGDDEDVVVQRRFGPGYGEPCRIIVVRERNEWGEVITRRIRRCG